MKELSIEKIEKQSKGRNGWFHPDRIDVSVVAGLVNVSVWSARKDGEPPIDLYLADETAVKVGALLTGSKADDLVKIVAGCTKDGECISCGKAGAEPNPACDEHEEFVMTEEDARDTLHSLITEARDIRAGHSVMDQAVNARVRELLEEAFPWLLDPDETADGGDTVDAVMEMYTDAGGKVADGEEADADPLDVDLACKDGEL